tara:strand:+ start:2798 stop:2914 length:117 start_codon:yes stop_codon:yes gene_type:complete
MVNYEKTRVSWMLIIVGILVTMGMVFGGYVIAGGAMEP